jgi:hypothetical protein
VIRVFMQSNYHSRMDIEAAYKDFPNGRNTNEGVAELEDFERIPSLAFSVFLRFIAKSCHNASLRHSEEDRCREFRPGGSRSRLLDRRGARAESYLRRALAKRDLLMCIPPFASRGPWYLIKPSFLNLFIKKLTRARVVPIIVARVSCDIPANLCSLR